MEAESETGSVLAEVDEEESLAGRSITESVENTEDPTSVDDINSEMEAESEIGSVLELESGWKYEWQLKWNPGDLDPHVYPTTISLESDCVYNPYEVICMSYWLFYIETGTRYQG